MHLKLEKKVLKMKLNQNSIVNIEKRNWKWDEGKNQTKFKLGLEINEFISEGLLNKSEEEGYYEGKDGYPWKIQVVDGKINAIFFRKEFFPFPDMKIWDLDLLEFENEVNKILQPFKEHDKGNRLHVVFREFFVAMVCIISEENS